MTEVRAKCGSLCNKCDFRDRFNCMGCNEMKGKVFWGKCDLYKCASERGVKHCGQCSDLPCPKLSEAIANGHQKDRLENLLAWRDEK